MYYLITHLRRSGSKRRDVRLSEEAFPRRVLFLSSVKKTRWQIGAMEPQEQWRRRREATAGPGVITHTPAVASWRETEGPKAGARKVGEASVSCTFAPGAPRPQCALLSSREPSALNLGSLLGAPRLLSCHSWNAWWARRPPAQAWVASPGWRQAPLWVSSSHSAGPLYQSLSLTPTGSGPGLPTGCTLPAPVPRL